MKKWSDPQIWQLGIENTAGIGNEEYPDPNNPPTTQHPDWVWCFKHARWHPKNHS
ncbi:hypothetical protein CPJCM30710_00610 [Clostridium polyendosporum]|uniref:Uncharacterized protein n=2 Tax=Clostridium polyendosporum TaxID=69208 RepID=A0A919RVS4_9CLOT|nr:hypothetical protein CPJCM30710_00610 [Clostridium polyendosporum]